MSLLGLSNERFGLQLAFSLFRMMTKPAKGVSDGQGGSVRGKKEQLGNEDRGALETTLSILICVTFISSIGIF